VLRVLRLTGDHTTRLEATMDRYELITTNPNGTDSCSGVYDGWDEIEWALNEIASGEGWKVHYQTLNMGWFYADDDPGQLMLAFEFHPVEVK
jgi:hypothetical protein